MQGGLCLYKKPASQRRILAMRREMVWVEKEDFHGWVVPNAHGSSNLQVCSAATR